MVEDRNTHKFYLDLELNPGLINKTMRGDSVSLITTELPAILEEHGEVLIMLFDLIISLQNY